MAKAAELKGAVLKYMGTVGVTLEESLLDEVPVRWEIHGDCALLPPKSFRTSGLWLQHPQLLQDVARVLKVTTLARKNAPILHNDGFRRPVVQLLLGDDPIVTKKENGVQYKWDITKIMFSSGNISEKQRIAKLDLRGQVVVDLYAGIGYFTLNYLIHSHAKLVYACEWNPEAVKWLRNNLTLNKVEQDRCLILEGDNVTTCPKGVADHVNLGFIPSSEGSWRVACAALKKDTGGVLHVHGNVDLQRDTSPPQCWTRWGEHVATTMSQYFLSLYPNESCWCVELMGSFKVKSYGPKVDHIVADILCRPINQLSLPSSSS